MHTISDSSCVTRSSSYLYFVNRDGFQRPDEKQWKMSNLNKKQGRQAVYKSLQSQGQGQRKQKAYRCSKHNAYCLLSCREHATMILCLCRPTVTLHQGHGHRKEHEHIRHPHFYRHGKFECNILNLILSEILQVKD